MKNTVSESMEVLVAKSNSFKDFDFVVTAFGKAVSNRLTIKCQEKNKNICEFCKPRNWYDKKSNRLVAHSLSKKFSESWAFCFRYGIIDLVIEMLEKNIQNRNQIEIICIQNIAYLQENN